ncbi:MAG: insulinase family protein, partial [Candidatus Krumholzibacteria bacterium]|nr:insulinase family protein [Candidatus Krumholzibacteria bacterium]
MRKKVFIVMLTALVAVSFASLALAGKRPHPSKLKYEPLRLVTPQATEITLSNGLGGFFIEDHEIPMVNVVLLVKTYFPDKAKYGLDEMTRWVMRNGGTEKWPGDKLNDELEFIAADIEVRGGDLNTMFIVNCLKKDLPQVLDMFGDLVMNPAFPTDKIDMKRKTMLEDIRRRNDEPNAVAGREFARIVYKDHPYAWETTTASVNAITRDDLVGFHSVYFHPNNAIIGVSGDVTKDEI